MHKFRPDDPNDPCNGSEYHTGLLCQECGDKPAGTAWGPYWCQACNAARLKRISAKLAILAKIQRREDADGE